MKKKKKKESACSAGNAGDAGSVPGLGRFPWRRKWQPTQYSCLEKSMDRGAWRATVDGVAKSQTRLKQLSRAEQNQEKLFSSYTQVLHSGLWGNLRT